MNIDAASFEGGCTCGSVRYRMSARPLFVHCCHCRWCQRETGASFALNALVEADRLELTRGEVEVVDTPSSSGKGQKISRCPKCRIAVWSNYAGAGNAVRFLRVGTLDDPDRFPPDIHIFTASKQPWVVLPPDAPAVPEYYRASEHWPKESLERRAALAARLRVVAPGGARSAVLAAAAAFERQTGHRVEFTFGTGGGVRRMVAAQAPADVAVLPSDGASELEREGLAKEGSRVEVGSVGVGVGVRSGAPHPKIGTVEEFREALLAAKSVTYADPARGGTSGTYFDSVVLPRLGIAGQVRAKASLAAVGEEAVRRVADGLSEMVIVQTTEIVAVPGAELAGPLPKEIQRAIAYAALVVKSSGAPDLADRFVRFLASPPGRAAFEAAGFGLPAAC